MRIFVSVSLSEGMKNCVSSYASALRRSAVRGRYPGEENYHITLVFIGEYTDIPKVKSALKDVAFAPFEVSTDKIGTFGNLYYLGVTSQGRELERLAESVKDALDKAGISFDRKRFKGHITIGRDVETCGGKIKFPENAKSMRVCKFSLMSSDVIGGKRVYREIFSVNGTEK